MSSSLDFVSNGMISAISYRTNSPEEIVHPRVTTREGVQVVYIHKERDQPNRGFVPVVQFFQRLAHRETGLMATGYRANGRQTTISFNKWERVGISPALQAHLTVLAKAASRVELEAPVTTPVAPSMAMLNQPVCSTKQPAKATGSETIECFTAAEPIDFATHCCQGNGQLSAGAFVLDDLTMVSEGRRRLRFAPLGNRPAAPRLALVGITPGGQIERFAASLATMSVDEAASHAAFHGAQTAIKQLLAAHGFADRLGISLEGDLNQSPEILTTSVVKCCLMVDEGYKFAAPDIAASPAASRCATERLVAELRSFPMLRWVVIFGRPAWDTLHELRVGGERIIDVLREHGLVVLQFPHFAQNFQQRALFVSDDETEAKLQEEKPDYRKFAGAALEMRTAVQRALKAI